MNKIYLKFAQNLILIFLLFIESKASQDYNSFGIGLIDSILKGITFGYKPINRGLELIIQPRFSEKSESLDGGFALKYRFHDLGLIVEMNQLFYLIGSGNGFVSTLKTFYPFHNSKHNFIIIPSIGIEISDKVYLNNNFNYKNHEIINSFLSAIFVMNINNNYGISFLDKLIFIDKKISQT